MNPISGVNLQQLSSLSVPRMNETGKSDSSFKDFLIGSIHEVNKMQQDADKAVDTMMTGGDISPAKVLTAVQKADIAFKMMMQMRNKLIQAYQEIKDIRI